MIHVAYNDIVEKELWHSESHVPNTDVQKKSKDTQFTVKTYSDVTTPHRKKNEKVLVTEYGGINSVQPPEL